ncbi:MAG: hypothetical protein RL348_112 [Bacteroidota bacterium]|jgi:hypothetical protein
MLTAGFGELITDILTVNPAIRSIPSASAILDTSNYTFNAVTLSKDGAGFLQHGHSLFSVSAVYTDSIALSIFYPTNPAFFGPLAEQSWRDSVIFNNQFLTTLRYNTLSPSSYHVSATQLQLSGGAQPYKSNPGAPSVYDRRLESQSTLHSVDAFYTKSYFDTGHYSNPVISPDNLSAIDATLSGFYGVSNALISSLWNVVGYPPSGNTGKFRLVSSLDFQNSLVVSGNLSGVFNSQGVIDRNGFININPIPQVGSFSSGPYTSAVTNSLLSSPTVNLYVRIAKGDAVALALLGGVNHVGVWALDLKEMLKSGLNPPYSWNNINNSRKYKLIAKVTFWNNILNHNDSGGISGLVRLNEGTLFANEGPTAQLEFNFK